MASLPTLLAALVLAGLERLSRARFRALPSLRPWAGNDLVHFVVALLFATLTGGFVFWLSARLAALGVPRLADAPVPAPLAVLLALLLLDLGQYVSHRFLHAIGGLWEIHKVHHSTRALDWLANSRSHVLETAIRRLLAPLGLVALGMPRLPTVIASVILSVWAMFIHSNLRVDLRRLEAILITPRLHRIHHLPATTEKNFGAFFSIWDRMAGTLVSFDPSPDDVLGVPGEVETYPQTFLSQLVEPMRRIAGRRGHMASATGA
jgi:lathosterol oxidase